MLYMYAVPRAMGQYHGVTFDGRIVYNDYEEDIPASAVDEGFIENLSGLVPASLPGGCSVRGIAGYAIYRRRTVRSG